MLPLFPAPPIEEEKSELHMHTYSCDDCQVRGLGLPPYTCWVCKHPSRCLMVTCKTCDEAERNSAS